MESRGAFARVVALRWKTLLAVILFAFGAVVACNAWMLSRSRGLVFRVDGAVSPHAVALVLGTAPKVGAWKNPFFERRMDAAAALWRAGKVKHLLVSGDNSRREYDEPTAMRDALVERGVPIGAITLDYAGFRTLDSLYRAREVFGVREMIIVTDDWHLPRALFLAAAAKVDAVGVASEDVPLRWSAKTRVREWLSRVLAVADVYVLRRQPKYYGDPVALPLLRSTPSPPQSHRRRVERHPVRRGSR